MGGWATKFVYNLNAIKCYLMSIHSTKQPSLFEYSLNMHILKKVQDNPYLGIQISSVVWIVCCFPDTQCFTDLTVHAHPLTLTPAITTSNYRALP